MTNTKQLVDFALDVRWSDLSDDTKQAARLMFGNAAALAVAAARLPAVENAGKALRRMGRQGWSPVIGRVDLWNPLDAAMLTGIAIHLEDFDDTHLPTVLHPAAPIIPAALAVGHWKGTSSAAVLEAVAAGAEVAIRVGNSIAPGHYNRGWHVTGTVGRVGAAVAAGKLLGLNGQEMSNAIAIATTEAAGLTAALGTMTKSLHPGRAASDGLEAALLAAQGLSGCTEDPLTDPDSFFSLAAPVMDPTRSLDGLGYQWEVEQNAFKPYACGVVSHPVIDTAIELSQFAKASEVESVTVTINPVVLDVMGVREPTTALESKFSAFHCFAVGYLYGAGGLAEFSDAVAVRQEVAALRSRIRFETSKDIRKGAAKASMTTINGKRFEVDVPHATGSVQRPMTAVQLQDKGRRLVEPVLGSSAEEFLSRAFTLDAYDLSEIFFVSIGSGKHD